MALREANNMEVTLSGLDQQQTQNKSFKTLYTTMIFRESTCMFTPKFTNTFVHCNTQRERKKVILDLAQNHTYYAKVHITETSSLNPIFGFETEVNVHVRIKIIFIQ